MELDDTQKDYVVRLNRYLEAGRFALEKVSCELCGSDKRHVLFKNDRHGIRYRTVMCKTCGLIYSSPRLSENANAEFYASDMYRYIYDSDDFVDKFNELYRSAESYEYTPVEENYRKFSIIDFLLEAGINFTTVCEIGAGAGTHLVSLLSLGKECTGYEYSEQLTELGRQKGINLIQGGIEDVSGKYDLIMLCHVLEHFLHPVEQLKTLADFTERYLLIEVPGLATRLPSIQNAHQFYFTPNTLLKIASMAGLSCLKYKVFKDTNFIVGLFEKDNNVSCDYDYEEEVRKSLFVVNKYKVLYAGVAFLRRMKLDFVYKALKERYR